MRNETNLAGAGDVMSRSCDELNTLYLHYQSAYNHHTRQDGNLFWSSGFVRSRDNLKSLYLHLS